MRTIQDVEENIRDTISARESMTAIRDDSGVEAEGRSIFIENCNRRLAELYAEKSSLLSGVPPEAMKGGV